MDFECLHCLKLLGLVPKTPRISKEIRERVDEIGVTGIRFSGFLEVAKWCKDKVAQLKNDVLFKVFNRLDMITANNVQLAAQRQGGDKRLTLAGLSEFLLRVVGEQDIKEAVDKEHLCLNARDEGSPMQIVLANIIKDAKLDGQERFSFAEVRAYCQEVYEQLRKLHIQDEMIKAQDYKFEVHEILELHNSFDKMDRDCSGTLDLQEVKRAIHVMKKEKFVAGPSALQIAFRQLDEDRSGALDFVEYMHLVQMVRDGEGVFAEGNVVVTNILDLPVELLLDLLHSIGIGTRIADLYEDRDRDRLRAEAARRLGVDVEELLFDALGVATMRDLLGVAKMRSQST